MSMRRMESVYSNARIESLRRTRAARIPVEVLRQGLGNVAKWICEETVDDVLKRLRRAERRSDASIRNRPQSRCRVFVKSTTAQPDGLAS